MERVAPLDPVTDREVSGTIGWGAHMRKKDPLEEALEKVGVHLEKKDVNPVTQMIASGLGGLAGNVGGSMLKLGIIGKGVLALAGAVVGHVAVTYRIHLERPKDQDGMANGPEPESPMPYSGGGRDARPTGLAKSQRS